MNQKILGISGRKQAGKSSAAAMIVGFVMRREGLISRMNIDDPTGGLLIPREVADVDGNVSEGWGIFDPTRQDPEFLEFANNTFWNYVKIYSFADTLKTICIRLFGLTFEQCYGTDEQKNSLTQVKYKDIAFLLDSKKKKEIGDLEQCMTARQVLQYTGTDFFRRVAPNCWVNDCLNTIEEEGVPLAIISDCRFKNEIEIPRERGAKVIRLTKRLEAEDTHSSETELDNYEGFDKVIDNNEMDIREKTQAVVDYLQEIGWI